MEFSTLSQAREPLLSEKHLLSPESSQSFVNITVWVTRNHQTNGDKSIPISPSIQGNIILDSVRNVFPMIEKL